MLLHCPGTNKATINDTGNLWYKQNKTQHNKTKPCAFIIGHSLTAMLIANCLSATVSWVTRVNSSVCCLQKLFRATISTTCRQSLAESVTEICKRESRILSLNCDNQKQTWVLLFYVYWKQYYATQSKIMRYIHILSIQKIFNCERYPVAPMGDGSTLQTHA